MDIQVLRRLDEKNQASADEIRATLARHGVHLVNLMGSPGCGKTALLEQLLPHLRTKLRCAVLEGDLFTTQDAERIAALNTAVIQLETQGACHLDANLVGSGLGKLTLDALDLVFVENVGNLVCPANFDVGEHRRIAVISVTEGHDKPAKYPMLFSRADAIVVTKLDLLEHTNFNRDVAYTAIRQYNSDAPIFETSIRREVDAGLIDWLCRMKS